MTLLEWGMLCALSLLWGGAFFFNSVAVKELPTVVVVTSRVSLAAIILHLALRLGGNRPKMTRELCGAYVVLGMLGNVIPFSLIVWGQSHIPSGLAAILNATTPLFTVILAQFLTADERLTPGRFLGVGIGLAGVMIMIGGDALQALDVNIAAQLGCLAAAFCYALGGVFALRFKAIGVSPMEIGAGQLTAASVLLIPVMLAVERPWSLPAPGAAAVCAVVGLAALSTALAYILYFRILASAGVTNLSLVSFLIPVSAILLGVVVLGEALRPKHLLGMALIGCGLVAIDGRLWRGDLTRLLWEKPGGCGKAGKSGE